MKANGKTKQMDKAHIFGKMEENIQENGNQINNMEKANYLIKMGILFMKANGKKVNF